MCSKSDRDCQYAQAPTGENDSETRQRADSTVSNADQSAEADSVEDAVPTTEQAESVLASSPTAAGTTGSPAARPADFTAPFVASFNPTVSLGVDNSTLQPAAVSDADIGFSPLALSQTSLLNISPFEWYDLLAQDAINNIQRLNSLPNGEVRWVFDESTLSRRQTPLPESPTEQDDQLPIFGRSDGHITPPWNTSSNIELSEDELVHFRYYVDIVGPILDLFDPERHFSNMVPHLAVRNAGLLKSILAVAARHMSLGPSPKVSRPGGACHPLPDSALPASPAQEEAARSATQYYYETLQYLSHTLLYPSYANSHEILATAIMISTYEMFDSNGPSNNGDWERHLRGAFWIQRSQDNNAESADSFRRAVWWAWIRQDIWAAFRSGRRTLTIFQPQKTLQELKPDDLASRVLFIAAKCVAYAAYDAASSMQDLQQRINLGNRLLRSLEEWREALPTSFAPISGGAVSDTVSRASRPSSASPSVHHVGQAPGPAATQTLYGRT
ncbi:hypothetical protein COL154_006616 [Colletotrichum chrysophilum]|uniref:uncharacterized protein n=1 Tax=Colletotrichum chrysophilum TaxID=1836956 RepID=UPI0023013BF9|nr:uncharacterized protein COL26b_006162 [Colletotrichum chrysophilum]KAJ0361880.1 hypothetical protein COL154_006616 [Colletotrichum chrysophilum]KAJ0375656.1 hypothetical protein COL26b_006162 [Colletotrichum chrysophilum]